MKSNEGDIDKVLAFYGGSGCDHRGRTLDEMLQWDNDALEFVHDYIQWLFPLTVPSGFNPEAPVLSSDVIQQFRDTPQLRNKLLEAFKLLLGFYGFELNEMTVRRSANFRQRADNWLFVGNHNMLRITRILTCLSLLGLREYATGFLRALTSVFEDNPSVIRESYAFWQKAATAGEEDQRSADRSF